MLYTLYKVEMGLQRSRGKASNHPLLFNSLFFHTTQAGSPHTREGIQGRSVQKETHGKYLQGKIGAEHKHKQNAQGFTN